MIYLYNTLTKKKEKFIPVNKQEVGLYTCGPTVYWFAHVGNLRTYIFEDILKRALNMNGYKVKHVMNITDVGHLTSDSDSGEDKLEKGAKAEKKTVWEIADFYTQQFLKDIKMLNITDPDVLVKATDTIKEQIELITLLEKKGYTYVISDGVYFDTSKLDKYGKLWGEGEKTELRGRIEEVKEKKNQTDFALWKFSPKNEQRQMEWDSPWGIGFPGWHTECVVMSVENLGIPFDIHCGGIDHVSIHHTNEIAQAEAAYEKTMANFWMHGEFLNVKEGKMSKSLGNIITVSNLVEKGITPLAYRYLCLNTHYRQKLTFSDESLLFAENTLEKLYDKILEIRTDCICTVNEKIEKYINDFTMLINDDLNTPSALALTWEVLKSKSLSNSEKCYLMFEFDKIFGLGFNEVSSKSFPNSQIIIKSLNEKGLIIWSDDLSQVSSEIINAVQERIIAREKKEWTKSDELREYVKDNGWDIEDREKQVLLKRIAGL